MCSILHGAHHPLVLLIEGQGRVFYVLVCEAHEVDRTRCV